MQTNVLMFLSGWKWQKGLRMISSNDIVIVLERKLRETENVNLPGLAQMYSLLAR